MTSWMECGCGGDVILYENPGAERYGKKWMLYTGHCKLCGRYHETVSGGEKAAFERARQEYEEQSDNMARYRDGLYHGAVGANELCSDEDYDRCVSKLMAIVWKEQPKQFWILKDGMPVKEWTLHEAESEGWFNYHLKLDKWYPINGGDDAERYTEELCYQTLDQAWANIRGRITKWSLWKRGMDHWEIGGTQLDIERMAKLKEVFA